MKTVKSQIRIIQFILIFAPVSLSASGVPIEKAPNHPRVHFMDSPNVSIGELKKAYKKYQQLDMMYDWETIHEVRRFLLSYSYRAIMNANSTVACNITWYDRIYIIFCCNKGWVDDIYFSLDGDWYDCRKALVYYLTDTWSFNGPWGLPEDKFIYSFSYQFLPDPANNSRRSYCVGCS